MRYANALPSIVIKIMVWNIGLLPKWRTLFERTRKKLKNQSLSSSWSRDDLVNQLSPLWAGVQRGLRSGLEITRHPRLINQCSNSLSLADLGSIYLQHGFICDGDSIERALSWRWSEFESWMVICTWVEWKVGPGESDQLNMKRRENLGAFYEKAGILRIWIKEQF